VGAIGKPRDGFWREFSAESHYEVVIADICGAGDYSLPFQIEPFNTGVDNLHTSPQQLY